MRHRTVSRHPTEAHHHHHHHGGTAINTDTDHTTDDDEHPTIGEFGTAHVIHTYNGDAYYLDASVWTVHDLNGSNPDDNGHVHYLARDYDALYFDHEHHTVHPADTPRD